MGAAHIFVCQNESFLCVLCLCHGNITRLIFGFILNNVEVAGDDIHTLYIILKISMHLYHIRFVMLC